MAPLTKAHVGIRSLQGASALGAMIFISLGYVEFATGQLSSGAAIFSTIANYSALLTGAYYVIGLGYLNLSATAPKPVFQRLIDGALAGSLALAGVLHMSSEAVSNCEAHNTMFESSHNKTLFRCSNISVGIMLTFATAVLSAAAFGQSFFATPVPVAEPVVVDAAAVQYASAMTPVTKPHEILASEESLTTGRLAAVRAVRLGGRAVQFGCALLAFICTVAGYKHYYTGQYLSPKATYTILMTYTCWIYSMWHLVAVQHLKLSRRPSLKVERVVDGVLAFALLVAGVVLVTSAHVQDCDAKNDKFMKYHGTTLFRCGSSNAGVAFTFISVALYLVTVAVSYVSGAQAENSRDSVVTVDENADHAQQA